MGLHHSDKRDATYKLANALKRQNWKVYGYSEDKSDAMTDLYMPGSWSGVAVHPSYPGFAVVCGWVDLSKSGSPIHRTIQEVGGQCSHCTGTGVEPNALIYEEALKTPELAHENKAHRDAGAIPILGGWRVNRSNYHDNGSPKCTKCRGRGEWMNPRQEQIDTYPTFTDIPGKGVFWILQKDGKTVKSGKGMSACAQFGKEGKQAADTIAIDITEHCKNYSAPVDQSSTTIAASGDTRIEVHISKGTSPSGNAGIEITFSSPDLSGKAFVEHLKANGYIDRCKALGFRWSSRQQLWYASYSDRRWDLTHSHFEVQQKTTR